PLAGAVDSRVRTGRVPDDYRAVLVKLEHNGEATDVLPGVWKHDEGNARALRSKLNLNPINGIVEIIEGNLDQDPGTEAPGTAAGAQYGVPD
ncbi:hypothetical protein, partial [Bacillus cereus]|uniref:hypothetical protein n=1 Tax=Bacillus cereus TaxID=1396 RepID=UPI0021128F36|nr:hypothetical protein [Bacillus cereus]